MEVYCTGLASDGADGMVDMPSASSGDMTRAWWARGCLCGTTVSVARPELGLTRQYNGDGSVPRTWIVMVV